MIPQPTTSVNLDKGTDPLCLTCQALGAIIVRMRKRRLKMLGEGWYHLTSRCVLQQFLFKGEDKEMLVRMMKACAYFSGIEILAYAVLDNHFHLLAHVPSPTIVPEEEVLRRVGVLYGFDRADDMRKRWKEWRDGSHARLADEELDHLRSRMGDVSKFMKLLKQRFSVWYRANTGDIAGTIWQGRFGSILVEGDPRALCAIAAYIDLNPVRAGIVSDPKDYRWSSYGAACAGVRTARAGLMKIFATAGNHADTRKSMAFYRELLYLRGSDTFSAEDLKAVIASHGSLTVQQLFRCKVRFFTAGAAFGSDSFVEAIFESNRDWFGPNRSSGARGIGLCKEWDGFRLCTLRDLRVNAITHP